MFYRYGPCLLLSIHSDMNIPLRFMLTILCGYLSCYVIVGYKHNLKIHTFKMTNFQRRYNKLKYKFDCKDVHTIIYYISALK